MSLARILSALADENRRRVLETLKQGRISSGDLAAKLGMTPQALSYHLSKLKGADLIYETRYKNFIYYELDLTVLDEAVLWLNALRGGNENENEKSAVCGADAPAAGDDAGGAAAAAGADPGPLWA